MLAELFGIIVFAVTAIYIYLTRNFGYWKKQGIPFDIPLPFFGSRKDLFFFKSHECIDTDRIYNKFYDQPYAGFFEGDEPVLLVKDPQLVKQFFTNEMDMPFKRRMYEDENSPFTQSLLFVNGMRWKKQRMLLNPGFTSAKMKSSLPLFMKNITVFKQLLALNENVPVEVGDMANRFTMDNVASWIFGFEISSLKDPDNEFRQKVIKVMGPGKLIYLLRLMAWFFQPLAKPLGLSFPGKDITEYMIKVIKDLVTSRESGGEHHDDILQRLISVKDQEILPAGYQQKQMIMSTDMIAANAFTLLIGGMDTSSSTITFCLLELAVNQTIQDKLYEEVCDKLGHNNNNISYENLMDMKYLDMVVQETFRKWPAGAAVGRVTSAPCTFPGTTVFLKSGVGILIPIWSIHRDPKFYPEPEKFDPERFNETARAQREPSTYLPFAEGPHICIGMRLGLLQVKVAVCSIISEFRVDVCENTISPVEIDPSSLVNIQRGGTWLKFIKRLT